MVRDLLRWSLFVNAYGFVLFGIWFLAIAEVAQYDTQVTIEGFQFQILGEPVTEDEIWKVILVSIVMILIGAFVLLVANGFSFKLIHLVFLVLYFSVCLISAISPYLNQFDFLFGLIVFLKEKRGQATKEKRGQTTYLHGLEGE